MIEVDRLFSFFTVEVFHEYLESALGIAAVALDIGLYMLLVCLHSLGEVLFLRD